jgi:hypothetical protein
LGVGNIVYREGLPRYNTALGPAQQTLVVAPPFTYPGVTARVFPLRAWWKLWASLPMASRSKSREEPLSTSSRPIDPTRSI